MTIIIYTNIHLYMFILICICFTYLHHIFTFPLFPFRYIGRKQKCWKDTNRLYLNQSHFIWQCNGFSTLEDVFVSGVERLGANTNGSNVKETCHIAGMINSRMPYVESTLYE